MAKANRECYTCGHQYHYCPTCPSETKKETFYNMFCCERCSKIFKTLTDETFKHLTTSQCKERLLQLNVSLSENFKEGINKHIAKVFDYKEPAIETAETVEEMVSEIEVETDVESKLEIEDVSSVETTIEISEENEVTKMNYIPKKNRKKQNSEVN